MIKLYFKQAFQLLKENKLLSSISIIGTALAIAMIMVIVITLRATIAPFAPETHRDRMLVFRYAGLQNKSNVDWQNNGSIGYNTARACFKEMTVPEAVTITNSFQETMLASKPAGEMESCSVLQTDDAVEYCRYILVPHATSPFRVGSSCGGRLQPDATLGAFEQRRTVTAYFSCFACCRDLL